MPTGLLDQQSWFKSQGNRNWLQEWSNSLGGQGLSGIGNQIGALKSGQGVPQFIQSQYDAYYKKAHADELVSNSVDQANRQGLLGDTLAGKGDQIRNANSAGNQFNLRNMSSQFNAMQPKYGELAAQQGLGGSVVGMQEQAAKRNAGLLTNANFGTMMQDNQKTALGYYGQAGTAYAAQGQNYAQAEQANQGLLSLDLQERMEQAKLKQQQAQFDETKGSIWDDLLTTGLGVAGSFLGGAVGKLGGGLANKWLGNYSSNNGSPTNDDSYRYYT